MRACISLLYKTLYYITNRGDIQIACGRQQTGYNKHMQFLRKAALTAAASLLTLSLFSFGLSWSLFQVFGSSGPVKQALTTSGIYDGAVSEVLKQHQEDQPSNAGSNDIPVNDPAVQAIIKDAFPPSLLQAQSEKVIDATYGWLNGSQSALQFNVDLSGAKTNMANGIAQYAQTRLNSLPTCAPDQLPSGTVDAFSATCIPAGFDQSIAVNAARDQVLNGDFLKNPQLTQNTQTSNGKSVAQQLNKSRNGYQHVRTGILLLGILAAALAAVVIALAATWRVGVRKVSIILITVGAVSAVLAAVSSFAGHAVVHRISTMHGSNTSLQQQIATIAQTLLDDLKTHWLVYGLALVAIGIVALVVLRLTRPKNPIDIRPKKPSKYVNQAAHGTETISLEKQDRKVITTPPADTPKQAEEKPHDGTIDL
jgi:hypothetical protein